MRKLYILFNDNYAINITIKGQPSEVGGEGYIYKIKFPRQGILMLKLYKTKEKALKNRDKILALVHEGMPQSSNPNLRFCWPIGIAYEEDRKTFAGFVMPEAFPNSRDLYILEYYGINSSIKDEFPEDKHWHDKFELSTQRGLRNRLVILHNWATALSVFHSSGQYALGDIKPTNVMAEPLHGKISIIDIDSCQIMSNGSIRFARTAQTPSYRPPEISSRVANSPIGESYDSFSFAVSAYTILTGTHPFSNCRLLPPYDTDEYSSIVSCIRNGLSPIGDNNKYTQRIISCDLHANLNKLPIQLIRLFKRALGTNIERPNFRAWRNCLRLAINEIAMEK